MLPPATTLEVYAAASLREVFVAVARRFEATHPGLAVRLNFGGSQTLASQIANGAPADVFASADDRNLRRIAYDPTTRKVFALNRLVVVSKKGVDLKGLISVHRIVVGAHPVPVGGYSESAFASATSKYGRGWAAQVRNRIVSRELDVRAVLAKVRLGEADAGIVYASDALSAGKGLRAVLIPEAFQPKIVYPVAVPKDAFEPRLAREFIDLLLSREGRLALTRQGFRAP